MTQVLAPSRPLDGLRQQANAVRNRAAALWRAHPRGIVSLGLFGMVAAAAVGTAVVPGLTPIDRASAAPPAPPPLIMRQVAPDQAVKINADIPVVGGPNPSASPFVFKGNAAAHTQALNCLANATYYEAGNQDADGERAVAQVVLNRVRHPAFPASICRVVYEGSTRSTGCQFTFTCDGSLNRRPDADGWRRSMAIAEAALSGFVYAPVGWATHYHANYVVPYWASSMSKSAVVGDHLFYHWTGGWGQPAVFTKAYDGREPSADALRSAALAAVHVIGGTAAEAIRDIPGAETLKLAPSLRGDKRVAVRFNLTAHKAADEATHEDYAKKFEASDNLKWSLSGDAVAAIQQPLGRPASSASQAIDAAGASAQR